VANGGQGETRRPGRRRPPAAVKVVLKGRAVRQVGVDIARHFGGRGGGRVLLRPPPAAELRERAVLSRTRLRPRRAMRANAAVGVLALVVFSTWCGHEFMALSQENQDRVARAVGAVFDQALGAGLVGLAVNVAKGRPLIRVMLEGRRRDSGESVLHAGSLRWETTGRVARLVCAAIGHDGQGAGHGPGRD